jgi:hypothetical protein
MAQVAKCLSTTSPQTKATFKIAKLKYSNDQQLPGKW